MSDVETKDGEQLPKTPLQEDNGIDKGLSPNADYKSDKTLDENGNPVIVNAPEKEEVKISTEDKPKFDKTGLQQVESLLVDAGLDMVEVAKAVTQEGGNVTPAILKALEDKHGAQVASLIVSKLQGLHESNVAQATAKDAVIFDLVHEEFKDPQGGEATWKELAGWAKDNIPVAERKEINALLGQGGMAAKFAVKEIISLFKVSPQFSQAADLELAESLGNDKRGGALDKTGYSRELRKLLDTGHNYDTSPEIADLNRRREQSRKRGI